MAKLVYEPLGWVALRTTSMSWDSVASILDRASKNGVQSDYADFVIRSVSKWNFLRNGIALASPALHSEMIEYLDAPDPPSSKRSKLARSLLLYATRAASRPTPFGLFAGYSVVQLASETSIQLVESESTIFLDLDYGYLVSNIEDYFRSDGAFLQTRVQANRSIQVIGDRIFIQSPVRTQLSSLEQSASIKSTSATNFLLHETRKPAQVKYLQTLFAEAFPATSKQRFLSFLRKLVGVGFLLVVDTPLPLRYSSRTIAGDKSDTHINSIRCMEATARKLEHRLAEDWRSEDLGLSNHSYRDGERVKSAFHAILRLGSNKGTIHQRVAHDAALVAQLVLGLSRRSSIDDQLDLYRERFIEEFGERAEVTFIRMINDEIGIGHPNIQYQYVEVEADSRKRHVRGKIAKSVANALWRQDKRVELSKDLVDEITEIATSQRLPHSLDLFLFLASKDVNAIDKGDYLVALGPTVGVEGAFRSLGRFEGTSDQFVSELRKSHHVVAQADAGDIKLVGLGYRPQHGVIGNVMESASSWDHYIDIGFSDDARKDAVSIPLSEIAVGVHEGKFYLRWVRTGERISVQQNDMLSRESLPACARTLVDIAMHGIPRLHRLDLGWARHLPFIPRIQTGRIVLQSARWLVNKDDIPLIPLSDEKKDHEAVTQWAKKADVPRWVWLGNTDERLILDLSAVSHTNELARQLRKAPSGESVLLEEAIENPTKCWCHGNNGGYFSELVFPLRLKKSRMNKLTHEFSWQSPPPPATRHRDSMSNEMGVYRIPPGREWLYVKFYMSTSIQSEFLSTNLSQLVLDQLPSNCRTWHFVRYADPNPHVRLRFHFKDTNSQAKFHNLLNQWGEQLMTSLICRSFCFDTYLPEIDRYGGQECVSFCEELFSIDSELTLRALQCTKREDFEIVSGIIAALLISAFADENGGSPSLSWWHKQLVGRRTNSNLSKRDLTTKLGPMLNDPSVSLLISDAKEMLMPCVHNIKHVLKSNLACVSILNDFLHMHCNRSHGIDDLAERRIRRIAKLILIDNTSEFEVIRC